MSPEIDVPDKNSESSPQNALSNRQQIIVNRAHFLNGGRTGDVLIGPMLVRLEPQVLTITVRGDKQIKLEQDPVAVDQLGVISAITLSQLSCPNGQSDVDPSVETIYRCNETLGIKSISNGHEPQISSMNSQDFVDTNNMLDIIESYLRPI